MSLYSSKIGNRIRIAREEKDWRQEDLAENIGKTSTYIGMIERGERIGKLERKDRERLYSIIDAYLDECK